jgi:hypothetical protein
MHEAAALRERLGGFLKGICHPGKEYALLKGAGFGWVRRDVVFPLDETGGFSKGHCLFLEETKAYAENGLRSQLITPYPFMFMEHGIDPRTPEGLQRVEEVSALLAQEYRRCAPCWQASNELFNPHFRAPLTAEQSRDFIIATLHGLRKGDPAAVIGHNSVQDAGQWDDFVRQIDAACDCDYMGLDLYNGSWTDGGPETYIEKIREVYALCQKPVILAEFGFASAGRNASPDFREAYEYIREKGFSDLEDVFARSGEYIETLPGEMLKEKARSCAPQDVPQQLYNSFPHVMKMWFAQQVFAHTEDGQAQFYAELLPLLLREPCLAGAIVYCWMDAPYCGFCGAADCPCETAWGLLRTDGTPKKAYDTVRRCFAV